jgi:hypothetical protein
MSCSITTQDVAKGLRTKALPIAKSVDPNFKLINTGELILPVDRSNPRRSQTYQLKSVTDRAAKAIEKQLGLDKSLYGTVVSPRYDYTDGAAISIIVTPRLLNTYAVKNEETSLEEVNQSYRPKGFYNEDSALAEQEMAELENDLQLETAQVVPDTQTAYTPSVPVQLNLDLRLSSEATQEKGNLDDIGFKEDLCNI